MSSWLHSPEVGKNTRVKARRLKKVAAVLATSAVVFTASIQAANAYGSGTWNYAPPTCNAGSTYNGNSSYDFNRGSIFASTSERGNFCFAPSKYDIRVTARTSNNTQSPGVTGRDYVQLEWNTVRAANQGGGHSWYTAYRTT